MSGKQSFGGATPERKIRFRSTARILYGNENRVEDLFPITELRNRWEHNTISRDAEETKHKRERNEPSLLDFLKVELTRGYLLENDEERYSARREKVYSFMKIPQEVEKFMVYGFFQCADSFLFVYTFLPMRFILALWAVLSRPIKGCFGLQKPGAAKCLTPAEICDLLKACILISCSMMMTYIDTSMMYHLIKSQSVIKLYIFYNMLEVGDRLFSAFGQDTIDALFWTATEPRDRRREHLGVIPHLIFAVTYVFLHSLLVLFQATTLNVAINSNNKALLTIMMSNNFVELKGSVFKKFDKNNLFQVSCSDVRERFHLFVLLSIVVLQTMKEYAWKEDRLWVLVLDCLVVLFAEVLVDWIKHAFITRFNELPVDVYRDYTTSLAYDMAQTRQKHAFSDQSDLVARRMGFIPLPLGVVMVRVLLHSVRVEGPAALCLALLAYLCLVSLRVLISVQLLGKACDLIAHHQHEKGAASPGGPHWVHRATSPINGRPHHTPQHTPVAATSPARVHLHRSATLDPGILSADDNPERPPSPDCTFGSPAIFSNSSVSINSACLNEALLDEEEHHEVPVDMSQSVPDLPANLQPSEERPEPQGSEDFLKKRAESEPSLPLLVEAEMAGTQS